MIPATPSVASPSAAEARRRARGAAAASAFRVPARLLYEAMTLVRARAWWFNKVPFSVMLVLLLAGGHGDARDGLAVLALGVLTVCAVANYGYAVNDIHDVEEDGRIGRANAAAAHGASRLRAAAIV